MTDRDRAGAGDRDTRGRAEHGEDRRDQGGRNRRLEKLGNLLPAAARELGLDDQLLLARAMAAWERLLDERLPAARGASRLVSVDRGVATVETPEAIVAQEIRLRSIELLAALRVGAGESVRELRVVVRRG